MPFTLAIVGRPNVGKSTLFNRLTRSRRALVHDNPGVTRDRIYGDATLDGRSVRIIDTGGIFEQAGLVQDEIERQADAAMGEADLLLLIVDVRAGLNASDDNAARRLRKLGKPWLLVANKADIEKIDDLAGEFHRLGAADVIPVSAEHGRNLDALEKAILERLPGGERFPPPAPAEKERRPAKSGRKARFEARDAAREAAATGEYRVAIVGRPNVGKSSLFNRLCGEERAIVLDLPGTTRDTIDTKLANADGEFLLVDTAGIRRKSSTERGEEVLSVVLARKAIDAAEVCLLVIDAEAGITHQDATVAGLIEEAHRAVCVIVNKYDRISADAEKVGMLENELKRRFAFMAHAPILRVSALKGSGCPKILPLAAELGRRFRMRLSTKQAHELLPKLIAMRSTPLVQKKEYKLKHLTQAQSSPPFFVFFTNREYPPPGDYQRFLENRLRELLGAQGVPIVMRFKKSAAREGAR